MLVRRAYGHGLGGACGKRRGARHWLTGGIHDVAGLRINRTCVTMHCTEFAARQILTVENPLRSGAWGPLVDGRLRGNVQAFSQIALNVVEHVTVLRLQQSDAPCVGVRLRMLVDGDDPLAHPLLWAHE